MTVLLFHTRLDNVDDLLSEAGGLREALLSWPCHEPGRYGARCWTNKRPTPELLCHLSSAFWYLLPPVSGEIDGTWSGAFHSTGVSDDRWKLRFKTYESGLVLLCSRSPGIAFLCIGDGSFSCPWKLAFTFACKKPLRAHDDAPDDVLHPSSHLGGWIHLNQSLVQFLHNSLHSLEHTQSTTKSS